MPYIANTDKNQIEMLAKIGVSSVAELFHDVPEGYRFPELKLPRAASELEVLNELYTMALKNSSTGCYATFLGAGAYNHFVPSAVQYLAGRGEFLTAYTPYQPEVSQGTLQSIFEYQSMIAELTGMDVVNASHYDGATSMAEAAIMAVNVSNGKRKKIIVAPSIHPQYRQTLRTYLPGDQVVITGDENLNANLDDLKAILDRDTACLVVQNPSFLGDLLDVDGLADMVHAAGALLVVVTVPVMSLGMLTPPRVLWSGYCCRRRPAVWSRSQFWWSLPGNFCCSGTVCPQNAGKAGRRDDGFGRAPGICAYFEHPRAAHPPGKSDQQYLYQPGADRSDRGNVPGVYG